MKGSDLLDIRAIANKLKTQRYSEIGTKEKPVNVLFLNMKEKLTPKEVKTYAQAYSDYMKVPISAVLIQYKDSKKIFQKAGINERFIYKPRITMKPIIGIDLNNGYIISKSEMNELSKDKIYQNWEDVVEQKNNPQEKLIVGKMYNHETNEFHAKKTGKLWRKVDGMIMDKNDHPFKYSKFGINAKEMEEINRIERWTPVYLIGHYKTNTYQGKTTEFFEPSRMYIENTGSIFEDNSCEDGRYELSVHTLFSQMESTANPHESFIESARKGLSGLCLTDSSSVQAYTIAMQFAPTFKHVKPLFGVQLNEIKERPQFVINPSNQVFIDENGMIDGKQSFVAFDIETTGLSPIYDDIIQMSAVRLERVDHVRTKGRGKKRHEENFCTYDVVDKLDLIVHTDKQIPENITELTGITQEQVDNSQYSQKDAIQAFIDFCNDVDGSLLIGHNVVFDYRFINQKLKDNDLDSLDFEIFDTLPIARRVVPNSRAYNLTALSKKLKIKLEKAHNSLFDCETTGRIFFELMSIAIRGIQSDIIDLDYDEDDAEYPNWKTGADLHDSEESSHAYQEGFPKHVDLIAKDQQGIKDLYELISEAHVKHFYREPRIFHKEIIERKKNGNHFLLGSGDAEGELFDIIMNRGYQAAYEFAKDQNYDYLEIMGFSSLGWDMNYDFDTIRYQNYLDNMLRLAKEINAIPVVIGDVHHITSDQKIVFDILHNIKPGENHRDQSIKSAEQLMNELRPFVKDEKVLKDIVINNTQKIAHMIDSEHIQPVHTKLTPPELPGADDELREKSWKKAHELYGKDLDPVIEERINKELDAIIHNGYAVIYLTAKKLVDMSNEEGYLVGSRGSVGSSFVAFLIGITEMNALPPHYRSKHGDYLEWVDPKKWNDGFDLPNKEDPNHPGELLIGDGHSCIFEIFAGASGKKVPDIDLNFSNEIQHQAQFWLKDRIFDSKHVFRVGTCGTIAQKTAYAKVKAYEKQYDQHYDNATVDYLSDRLVGIKRTSGQHAAGVLIVPEDKDITDFSPYTYPANDTNSPWLTTQFTKEMMHDALLKMDCLGHDDESVLHFLQEMTGISPKEIEQPDIPEVVEKVFKNKNTVQGLPEFGTGFSSQILDDAHPKYFSDLAQISGLSHGKGVWTGNAEDLIKSGRATLQDVLGSRDKIMNDVMSRGWSLLEAHELVQTIKRHDKQISEETIKKIKNMDLPDWYVDSLNKITYLFPKAHGASYCLSAVRIAWYKLHYPREFYAAWLSYRTDRYEMDTILSNDPQRYQERINSKDIGPVEKESLKMAYSAITTEKATDKNRQEYDAKTIFAPVDPMKSEPARWRFYKEDGKTYPAISTLPNVSIGLAEGYIRYRDTFNEPPRHSKELKDFGVKCPKKSRESLIDAGLLED